jgi:hypothetical protein
MPCQGSKEMKHRQRCTAYARFVRSTDNRCSSRTTAAANPATDRLGAEQAENSRKAQHALQSFARRGITIKKKPARSERKRADAARICEQGLLNPARLVFGDELPTVGNQRGGRLITIGEVSVGHRKMRPNRYRGSDVDQGTYDGEPFSTYNERCHARTLRWRQPSATSPFRRAPA